MRVKRLDNLDNLSLMLRLWTIIHDINLHMGESINSKSQLVVHLQVN